MKFERPGRVWMIVLLSLVALLVGSSPGLAANPTPPAATLTLDAPQGDPTLRELRIAVHNSGATPIAAGAAWKLWRRTSPTATGRILSASGKLPALAAGESYTLVVSDVRNPGSYRFQVVWGPGKQAQVIWSDEMNYMPAGTRTPTPVASPSATATQSASRALATTAVAAPSRVPTVTATPHTALLPMVVGPGGAASVASPTASPLVPTHVINLPALGGVTPTQPTQPRWKLALLGLLAALVLAAVVGALTYLSQPGGEPNIPPAMEEPGPDDAPEEDKV